MQNRFKGLNLHYFISVKEKRLGETFLKKKIFLYLINILLHTSHMVIFICLLALFFFDIISIKTCSFREAEVYRNTATYAFQTLQCLKYENIHV